MRGRGSGGCAGSWADLGSARARLFGERRTGTDLADPCEGGGAGHGAGAVGAAFPGFTGRGGLGAAGGGRRGRGSWPSAVAHGGADERGGWGGAGGVERADRTDRGDGQRSGGAAAGAGVSGAAGEPGRRQREHRRPGVDDADGRADTSAAGADPELGGHCDGDMVVSRAQCGDGGRGRVGDGAAAGDGSHRGGGRTEGGYALAHRAASAGERRTDARLDPGPCGGRHGGLRGTSAGSAGRGGGGRDAHLERAGRHGREAPGRRALRDAAGRKHHGRSVGRAGLGLAGLGRRCHAGDHGEREAGGAAGCAVARRDAQRAQLHGAGTDG